MPANISRPKSYPDRGLELRSAPDIQFPRLPSRGHPWSLQIGRPLRQLFLAKDDSKVTLHLLSSQLPQTDNLVILMRTWPTSGHCCLNRRALSNPWCLRDALNNLSRKIKLTCIGSPKVLRCLQTWRRGCTRTFQLGDWGPIISIRTRIFLTRDRPQNYRNQ